VEKRLRPDRLWLKMRHSALLVIHLDSPNFFPLVLIGPFSVTTAQVQAALTGPDVSSWEPVNYTIFTEVSLLPVVCGFS